VLIHGGPVTISIAVYAQHLDIGTVAPTDVPIPAFEEVLAVALGFLGVPGVFIMIILVVLAVESWFSNTKRAVSSAKVVGTLVGRGGAWLFTQHPVRLVVTVVMTLAVLTVQAFMVRLSYTGGSLISMPTDPVRRGIFEQAFDAPAYTFIDSAFLAQFLKLDVISATYMLLSMAMMVYAYRAKRSLTLALLLAFPYSLFLFGGFSIGVLALAINLLFAVPLLIVGGSPDWGLVNGYLLDSNYLAIDLMSGIYTLAAFAAVYGARLVRQLWLVRDDQHVTN
jgi:hypothetical protein